MNKYNEMNNSLENINMWVLVLRIKERITENIKIYEDLCEAFKVPLSTYYEEIIQDTFEIIKLYEERSGTKDKILLSVDQKEDKLNMELIIQPHKIIEEIEMIFKVQKD